MARIFSDQAISAGDAKVAIIRLGGLSMESAETLVARVWRALEVHDIAAPRVSVAAKGDRLTIRFTFRTEEDAERVTRSVPVLSGVRSPGAPAQARQWRSKAEEYRAVADQTRNPSAQDSYRRMAQTYDHLAEQLEARAAGAAATKEAEAR